MSETTSDRLSRCYTGVVHDVMRAAGFADFTFPPDLRPIAPNLPLAGPAFTIEGGIKDDADPHETLLAWTGLLSRAPHGHVWVSQPNDSTVAHMGELSAETLKRKGVRGCLVDGLVRDLKFLLDLGFPTFCRGFTPRDIVGRWLPRSSGEPIRIANVTVATGDYILADLDGALRIPADGIEQVLSAAETAMRTENKVRTAILGGMDPQEAYRQFGKF
jgi:regulator of RNase E activity RraA